MLSEDQDFTTIQIQKKVSQVFGKEYSLDEIERGLADIVILSNLIEKSNKDEELLIYPEQFFEGI